MTQPSKFEQSCVVLGDAKREDLGQGHPSAAGLDEQGQDAGAL
jgi:hypothetical protein